LAISDFDNTHGSPYPGFMDPDRGYYRAIGIVYSMVSDRLYVSTLSSLDDCVATFDKDLNYLGAAVDFVSSTSTAKGIAIRKECCPVQSVQMVNNKLCGVQVGDVVFLQDVLDCPGTVCEGSWSEGIGNIGMTFNECDLSVTILDADNACGTFTLSSDGNGKYSECGEFAITVDICKDEKCFGISTRKNSK